MRVLRPGLLAPTSEPTIAPTHVLIDVTAFSVKQIVIVCVVAPISLLLLVWCVRGGRCLCCRGRKRERRGCCGRRSRKERRQGLGDNQILADQSDYPTDKDKDKDKDKEGPNCNVRTIQTHGVGVWLQQVLTQDPTPTHTQHTHPSPTPIPHIPHTNLPHTSIPHTHPNLQVVCHPHLPHPDLYLLSSHYPPSLLPPPSSPLPSHYPSLPPYPLYPRSPLSPATPLTPSLSTRWLRIRWTNARNIKTVSSINLSIEWRSMLQMSPQVTSTSTLALTNPPSLLSCITPRFSTSTPIAS